MSFIAIALVSAFFYLPHSASTHVEIYDIPDSLVPTYVPSDFEIEEARRLTTKLGESAASAEFASSGLDTAGITINPGGIPIKLPEDVYVDAYILDAMCIYFPDNPQPCPEYPAYALRYKDSDDVIIVAARSGNIRDASSSRDGSPRSEAAKAASRRRFGWLIAQLAMSRGK
ncbi:MAG: hypothetical protein R3C14_27820 [Caldilineaceae bacterium]